MMKPPLLLTKFGYAGYTGLFLIYTDYKLTKS